MATEAGASWNNAEYAGWMKPAGVSATQIDATRVKCLALRVCLEVRSVFIVAATRALQHALVVAALCGFAWPQTMTRLDREHAQDMLHVVGDEIRKHYYDPRFHGLNWDATLENAKQKVETSKSMNAALTYVAAALEPLNDSHTFFLPPQHVTRPDYGFQYQMVGSRCFVTRVRPKSDAERKGLRVGDEILTLNGYNVTRDAIWKMQYVFSVLMPQASLRLLLQDPEGNQRKLEIAAKAVFGKQVLDLTLSGGNDIWDIVREEEDREYLSRARYQQFGTHLIVLKVPEFFFSQHEVEGMIETVRGYDKLILDLRGNPGGAVETLKYLVGGMFDKDVKIAERVGRKEKKPEVAKNLKHPFSGELVVLVDSESASAAELFARVIQLEKRGTIVGDRSSGSVMEAKHYDERLGTDRLIFYGVSITEWDLIMSDGNSLEHVGVTPDESVLPSSQDLAAGRDPALAHAARLLGVTVTAEDAGKAFPYEWPAD
ncbi:MAG: S41 family peptidase [Candidatus Sulfotelmatobacter sp.]